MADMAQIPNIARMQHEMQDPSYERKPSSDDGPAPSEWRPSRRRIAPQDDARLVQLDLPSNELGPNRSDSSRSRYKARDTADITNTPLHQPSRPAYEESQQSLPTYHLRKGKEKSLQLLKSRNEHMSRKPQHTQQSPDPLCSADGSTASTSESNSSSTSEAACGESKLSSSSAKAMESEKELELYSRQIRIELRKAEMKELAEEAERAAALGQKSFAGRASTFGVDDESEIEIAMEGINSALTPSSQRIVRRTLDFGTPLRNRLALATPLVRRLTTEPAKISVKALRDVSEVVPSFKDFHLHLRTHFLRRNVEKRSLVFDEQVRPRAVNNPRSHRQSEQHVMDIWNNFNFGSWGSKRDLGFSPEVNPRSRCLVKASLDRADADTQTAELLAAEHLRTEIGDIRRPRIQVPPGLRIRNQKTFELQEDEDYRSPSRESMMQASEQKQSPSVRTSRTFPPAPKEANLIASSPTGLERQRRRQAPYSTNGVTHDGSPSSPIFVDDAGLLGQPMLERRRIQEHSLIASPLTPLSAGRSILENPEDHHVLTTPTLDQMDFSGPDFVTPVRLRDIRDNNNPFGKPALRLPEAPLGPSRRRSSSTSATPGAKFEACSELEHEALPRGTERHALHTKFERNVDDGTGNTEEPDSHVDTKVGTPATLNEMRDDGKARHSDSPDINYDESERYRSKDDLSCEKFRSSTLVTCQSSNGSESMGVNEAHFDVADPRDEMIEELPKPETTRANTYNENVTNEDAIYMPQLSGDTDENKLSGAESSDSKEDIFLERRNDPNHFQLVSNGPNAVDTSGGSVAGNMSQASANFGCECLISPASSLDSEDGDFELEPYHAGAAWTLLDHKSISPPGANHQSLQAAVAMFSRLSPSRAGARKKKVYYAAAKDNDDFLTNYLYCSKTAEVKPGPEPICSGSAPCQDTKIPCAEVCMGNFFETAMKFLPRKTSQSKLLSLSRETEHGLHGKALTWYDVANEKFDRLLERLVGSEYRHDDRCRLSYQAPTLKERKVSSVHGHETPPTTPPLTPQLHDEVYDDDLGAVVYVQSASLDLNSTRSFHSDRTETIQQRIAFLERLQIDPRRRARLKQDRALHPTLSDTTEFRIRPRDSQALNKKNSM